MVGFDIDTSLLQRKLRAIAKHAEALADELDEIGKSVCPECGSDDIESTRLHADGEVVESIFRCFDCDYYITSTGRAVDA